jgi:hypothetical protein
VEEMKAVKKFAYHSFFSGKYQQIVNSYLYDTLEAAEADIDNFQERFPTIDQIIIVPIYFRENFNGIRGRFGNLT